MTRILIVLLAALAFLLLGDPLLAERAERATLVPLLLVAGGLAALPQVRTRRTALVLALHAAIAVAAAWNTHAFFASRGALWRPVEVAWTSLFYASVACGLLLVFAGTRRAAGTAVAVAATLCFSLVYVPPKALVHRPKFVWEREPKQVSAPREKATLVTSDGVHLGASFIPAPAGAGPRAPAVLILHGVGGEQTYFFLNYVPFLHAQGYATMTFDFRGHGTSEGHTQTYGAREVEDVRTAVAWLRARPDVDPERIAVIGHSMGSSVSILAGAAIPEIRAVIADAGYHDLAAVAGRRLRLGFLPEAVGRLAGHVAVRLLAVEAGIDPATIQPIAHVARIAPRPLLLIHGTEDDATLVDYSRQLHDAAGDPREILVLEGVDHGRTGKNFPEVLRTRVAAFLARSLAPSAAQN